jgi:hypothetical protein
MPKIANWVQETVSGTPGTGAINLGGAVSGFIKFADSGIASGSQVIYDIEDGVNREHGIGTITSGTPWTLSRDTILATLNTGTYDDTSPTALVLTSSAKVGIVASAESSGLVVGTGYAELNTVQTIATTIPVDDTIPQNTEGTEVLTLTYTPKFADSLLQIEAFIPYHHGTASRWVIAAIFKDADASAIAVDAFYNNSTPVASITPYVEEISGSISSRTYKLRVGTSVASNFYLNGSTGTRNFGGKWKTYIKITELRQ